MKNYIKAILIQTIVWTLALSYFTLLRLYGQDSIDETESKSILEYTLVYSSIGLLFSIVFVSFDKLVTNKL